MTRSPLLRAGVAVVLCLLPAPGSLLPPVAPRSPLPVITEYPLPRPKAFPHDPAVGADGIVWYTDQVNSYIGRLDPATGKVTDYPTPTPLSGPHGIVVAPDGGVWYTGNFSGPPPQGAHTGAIGGPPAQAHGRWARHAPPPGQGRDFASPGGAGSQPYGIAVGTDGRIWYDESGRDQIVAFDPATERAETVKIPTPGSVVRNMAVDSSRARLWLALSGGQKLGGVGLQ